MVSLISAIGMLLLFTLIGVIIGFILGGLYFMQKIKEKCCYLCKEEFHCLDEEGHS